MTHLLRFALPLALLATACSGSDTPETSSTPATPNATRVADAPASAMSLEQRGSKIYRRCQACHTLEEDGRNKVGPNLWGIYGSAAGAKEGYAYSKAMLASEIVWDQETMDAYLTKPADYVKGTKMSFIGLKNKEDRDAVQAYMQSETTP